MACLELFLTITVRLTYAVHACVHVSCMLCMPVYRYGAHSMLQQWRAHVLLSELVTLLHSSNTYWWQQLPCSSRVTTHTYTRS